MKLIHTVTLLSTLFFFTCHASLAQKFLDALPGGVGAKIANKLKIKPKPVEVKELPPVSIESKPLFIAKDPLLQSILNTFNALPQFEKRISSVYTYVKALAAHRQGSLHRPALVASSEDFVDLKVLSAAIMANDLNVLAQLSNLHFILKAIEKSDEKCERAVWKYLALCAIKLRPMNEWQKLPLKELFKGLGTSGVVRDEWLSVPIKKAGVLRGLGRGRLPWRVEPRTSTNLLDGAIVLMSTSGYFKPITSKKAITLGWEKCAKLKKNLEYREATFNVLNGRLLSALDDGAGTILQHVKRPLVLQLMTLYAVNLEEIIKKGEQQLVPAK
jgi:hypothetical protein